MISLCTDNGVALVTQSALAVAPKHNDEFTRIAASFNRRKPEPSSSVTPDDGNVPSLLQL